MSSSDPHDEYLVDNMPGDDEEFVERMEAALSACGASPESFSQFSGCSIDEAIMLFAYLVPWTMLRNRAMGC